MLLPQRVYLLSLLFFLFCFLRKDLDLAGSKLACVEGWNEQRIWTLREALHSFYSEVCCLAGLSLVYAVCIVLAHKEETGFLSKWLSSS